MSLNIKSDEVHRLAAELATLTGESMTAAVREALKERLHRLRDRKGMADRLLAIGRDCAARLDPPMTSSDTGELYDEDGLFR